MTSIHVIKQLVNDTEEHKGEGRVLIKQSQHIIHPHTHRSSVDRPKWSLCSHLYVMAFEFDHPRPLAGTQKVETWRSSQCRARHWAWSHSTSALNLSWGFSCMTCPPRSLHLFRPLSPHVPCHSHLSNCPIKAKYPKTFPHLHRPETPRDWQQSDFHADLYHQCSAERLRGAEYIPSCPHTFITRYLQNGIREMAAEATVS